MNRLTPNLWAHSALSAAAGALETRQLDFNLARRSALIINRIIGQMFMVINTTTGHDATLALIQEVDTDPDNIDVEFAGAVIPDGVVLDSSRCFRHVGHVDRDTAAGVEGSYHTLLQKDWTNESENKRPISITPIRHHALFNQTIAAFYRTEVAIDYFIVELSLEEIGIINASRR